MLTDMSCLLTTCCLLIQYLVSVRGLHSAFLLLARGSLRSYFRKEVITNVIFRRRSWCGGSVYTRLNTSPSSGLSGLPEFLPRDAL